MFPRERERERGRELRCRRDAAPFRRRDISFASTRPDNSRFAVVDCLIVPRSWRSMKTPEARSASRSRKPTFPMPAYARHRRDPLINGGDRSSFVPQHRSRSCVNRTWRFPPNAALSRRYPERNLGGPVSAAQFPKRAFPCALTYDARCASLS